ncbi:hypothetical protein ACFCXH_14395 [Streptomyces nojiriensis]|uniref:hypothetical protein n=1 Tax=Streptomyces nojiriensis TaxID=66374 RepID=UPI0035E3AB61
MEPREGVLPLVDGPLLSHTWLEVIELPPPLFFATIGLTARITVKASLFARIGPIVLRDARVSLDPATSRHSGTAQLYVPAAAGPEFRLTGSLVSSTHIAGLIEALSFGGELKGVVRAPFTAAAVLPVTVTYDHGEWGLGATPQIEAAAALVADLDAAAYARLLGAEVWRRSWHLSHWQAGQAVRMGVKLSLDTNKGSPLSLREEPFAERIPVEDLIAGMRSPAPGGGIVVTPPGPKPVADRLRELLGGRGTDPALVLAALADAAPEERKALLADPATLAAVRAVLGDALWPVAVRILRGDRSETVPGLAEGTVFLAARHSRIGRYADALGVLLKELHAAGTVDPALAAIRYVRGTKAGSDALTAFPAPVVQPGSALLVPAGSATVSVFDPAFVSVPWLYSTVMHEYVHVLQVHTPITRREYADPDLRARREVEAYLWEIEHARGTGVLASKDQMTSLGNRLTSEYESLGKKGQAAYRQRYEAATALVNSAKAGVLPVNIAATVAEARNRVQALSRRLGELIRQRPDVGRRVPTPDEQREMARIDREVEAIRALRDGALVEVVLAENPNVQIVDRARGLYKYPVTGPKGDVAWVFGAIMPMWNLSGIPPSSFPLQEGIATPAGPGVDPRIGLGGTGIQGRAQPFPGDLDFVEEISVSAPSQRAAEDSAADAVIRFVVANAHARDREFLRLVVFAGGGRKAAQAVWSEREIRAAATDRTLHGRLARSLGQSGGGNVNSFWRAWITDRDGTRRLVDMTKLLNIHAVNAGTGADFFATLSYSEIQVVFFQDPHSVPAANLAGYASAMLSDGKRLRGEGDYLKAAKRIYNYFVAIGDMEAMSAAVPVFTTMQADVNRQLVVVEAVHRALMSDATGGGRGENSYRTRIVHVDQARAQLRAAARRIEEDLPGSLPPRLSPRQIAAEIRAVADSLRGGKDGLLLPDVGLERRLGIAFDSAKDVMNAGLQETVEALFARYVPK